MKTIKIILLATLFLSCTAEENAIQSTDCEGCVLVTQRLINNVTWEDTNEIEESNYPCGMDGHAFPIHSFDGTYHYRQYVRCY